MNPFEWLASNLKTRCAYFDTCININGYTYDCEIKFEQDLMLVSDLSGNSLFKCYLFEITCISEYLFSCQHYNTNSKQYEYATIHVPNFVDHDLDYEDYSF